MKKSSLIFVAVIIAALMGCQSNRQAKPSDLVVVEQTDTVHGTTGENNCYEMTLTIDEPVDGPQVLRDSVIAVVNTLLYEACERNAHFDENVVTFSKDGMFSCDSEQLLSHYVEKYKLQVQDSLWRDYELKMKLEAQTEKFVTFGVEYLYCGASCSSEKFYYVFDKKDGHRVKEIISHENLVRFFKDHPELAEIKADSWSGMPGWRFSPDYDFNVNNYGLLGEQFSMAINNVANHYLLTEFPYSQFSSYLSPEAQKLVE